MLVLDTNALMMPVECDLRLFEELERVAGDDDYAVPSAVAAELEKLSDGAGEEATAAAVARDLLERCRVVGTAAEYADDAVLELATRPEASGAVTNDAPLRDRLLARGVPVIGLRGQNKLAITQP
ncbi:MAG: PIN domain-containing protein [Haloarculaceae archaeon]